MVFLIITDVARRWWGASESVLIKKKMVMFVIKANNKTCFGEQLKY